MVFIECEQALMINNIVIEKYGGIGGVRDENLLKSALNSPQNLYFYQNANLYEIAGKYAASIIQNHAFLDGNKRTGFACMSSFLDLNNVILEFPEDDSVDMMVKIATKEVSFNDIVVWLQNLDNNLR